MLALSHKLAHSSCDTDKRMSPFDGGSDIPAPVYDTCHRYHRLARTTPCTQGDDSSENTSSLLHRNAFSINSFWTCQYIPTMSKESLFPPGSQCSHLENLKTRQSPKTLSYPGIGSCSPEVNGRRDGRERGRGRRRVGLAVIGG